jgi:hypothetical protein
MHPEGKEDGILLNAKHVDHMGANVSVAMAVLAGGFVCH